MGVRIAVETLRAIDTAIHKDQGSSMRGWLGKVIMHIGDAYRTGEDGHRSHMGASQIGGECARAIWYNFHWATKSNFPARILRLFNRGHLEEARFVAMLLMIGCKVFQQDAEGNQFRISHANGHFGGSGDGVVIGLPDLQAEQAALAEFKTHGEKSFFELAGKNWKQFSENLTAPQNKRKDVAFTGKGVRSAKFEHYVQMQVYMRKMGIPAGLYVAVNKNTDELYAEMVFLESEVGDQFLDRGLKLVYMEEAPKRISESPGFFKCMFCDHKPVCHLKAAPDLNCRTCKYSKPSTTNKDWICTLHDAVIPKETQLTGCKDYERNPEI